MIDRHKDKSIKFTVKHPATALDFLSDTACAGSKTKVKQLIKHGAVTVNNKPLARFDVMLKPGQTVILHKAVILRKPAREAHATAASVKPPVPVLFEDEHIIAVDKPFGLLSIATEKEKYKTLYRLLSDYLKAAGGTDKKIFIVHRLDRDASGVMVFAKSEETKRKLQARWDKVEKIYNAVVEGRPSKSEGTIRTWLKENKAHIVYVARDREEDADIAITNYKTLKSSRGLSLLEIAIETGRKHQIRVHMAHIGCPIAGDKKYGAVSNPLKRLALHAAELKIAHPVTGNTMELKSPTPNGFTAAVK